MVFKLNKTYVKEVNDKYSSTSDIIIYILIPGLIRALMEICIIYITIFKQLHQEYTLFSVESIHYLIISFVITTTFFHSVVTILFSFAGYDEFDSPIMIIIEGVKRLEIFYPYTIYRNCITKPIITGVVYLLTIVLFISLVHTIEIDHTFEHHFTLYAFLYSCAVNCVVGFLKIFFQNVVIKKYTTEQIFDTRVITSQDKDGTNTPQMTIKEMPQNDNLDVIYEDGEYVPPKIDGYYSN